MTVDSIIPAGSPTLIRSGVIARGLGVGTHVVRAMVARGQLPKPLRLSRNLWLFDAARTRAALSRLLPEGGVE